MGSAAVRRDDSTRDATGERQSVPVTKSGYIDDSKVATIPVLGFGRVGERNGGVAWHLRATLKLLRA